MNLITTESYSILHNFVRQVGCPFSWSSSHTFRGHDAWQCALTKRVHQVIKTASSATVSKEKFKRLLELTGNWT